MAPIDPSNKIAGLLAPVFALRHANDLGIGDTRAIREAVDFCAVHHFSVLQTLPIHETIGDHSPYNPISSLALSPALLTLTEETVPGLTNAMLREAAPDAWVAQLRAGGVKHNSVQPPPQAADPARRAPQFPACARSAKSVATRVRRVSRALSVMAAWIHFVSPTGPRV